MFILLFADAMMIVAHILTSVISVSILNMPTWVAVDVECCL